MKKQLICFCVISIIIVGSIITFGMQFEQPDDYLIAGIVGGAFGYGENQILVAPYISSILGLLMYAFNIITKIFNTYSVFLVLMYLLCTVNLHYFIYKQKKGWQWNVLVCFGEVFFSYFFTYTVISYLLIGTGILLFYSINGEKNERVTYIISSFSCMLGIMLRRQVFVTVLFLLIPTILLICKKSLKRAGFIIALMFVTLFSTEVINEYMYSRSDIWSSYVEWNNASTQFRDYMMLPYEKYNTVFEKEGWSRNDLEMISNWQYVDRDIFGTEVMNNIITQVSCIDRYESNLFQIIEQMRSNTEVNIILITGVLILFFKKSNNWKQTALLLLGIFNVMILLLALYVRERYVDRIAIPIAMLGLIQLLILNTQRYERFKICTNKTVYIICTIPLIYLMLALTFDKISCAEDSYNDVCLSEYIENNKNITFLVNPGVANALVDSTEIKDISIELYKSNVVKTGSWDTFTGRYYKMMENNNITYYNNLFKELIESEKMLYVSNNIEDVQRISIFLQQHYNIRSNIHEVETFPSGASVWKFTK